MWKLNSLLNTCNNTIRNAFLGLFLKHILCGGKPHTVSLIQACYASVMPRCRRESQKRKGGSKCWKKMLLHDSSLGLRSTSTSASLHWFPISFRIDFKFLLLTFKALHGLTAKYISDAQYWPGICPPDHRHLLMEPCWLSPDHTLTEPPAKSQTHQFSCFF